MNRIARHAATGAALFAVVSLSASAQSQQETALRAALSEVLDSFSRTSETGAVDAAPQKDEVSVSAGKDKSVAKISVSRNLSPGRLSAALSTPINQKDDATQFFTLDGPAEDVKLDLEWKTKAFGLGRLPDVDFPDLAARQLQVCNRLNVSPCSDEDLEKALQEAGRRLTGITNELEDFFTARIVSTGETASLLRLIPYRELLLGGSVGRTERKFFDLPGTEKEDDRLSYSLSAAYRRVFVSSRFTVSLTTQRKFKEAEKARNCTVVDGSTLERCKDLPLGEAAILDSVPFSIEYRRWWNRWAVSPKLAYDFEREVAAASMPIYLVADTEGRLTGGIRVDWEEHKDPVAFVFVSSPLGLD